MTDAVIFVDFLFHLLETLNSLVEFLTLLERCPYSEFFWSLFSRIWTEYGEMRGKTDQKNTDYGHFSCSVDQPYFLEGDRFISQNVRNTKKYLITWNALYL